MRGIERTAWLRCDYKRELKGCHRPKLESLLLVVLRNLPKAKPLDEKYRDHALTGKWKDHRDCHITPDLILIYHKPDNEALQLVFPGSHSELGL